MEAKEQTCTCGATPPPEARFCHMCGRPLHEEPARKPEAEDVREALPRKTVSILPISFGNPDALRSCYMAALLAALLTQLPVINLLCFLWWPGAGFLAVHNYRRRTGMVPATSGGAKLGWITGVFTFAISMLLGAVASLLPSEGGGIGEELRRQIEQSAWQPEVKQQVLEMLQNPVAVASMVLFFLATGFLLMIGFTVTGGALAARILKEE